MALKRFLDEQAIKYNFFRQKLKISKREFDKILTEHDMPISMAFKIEELTLGKVKALHLLRNYKKTRSKHI